MTPRFTPWVQKLVFTGRSFYTIDILSGGKVTAQRDVWDAIQDNSYLSLEGIAYVVRQLTSGQVSYKTSGYTCKYYGDYNAAFYFHSIATWQSLLARGSIAAPPAVQTSPRLESPKYVVWKKTKEYEIRRYSSFLAAEVSMPSDAKPASGEGFNELAGYIFGGNQR